MNRQSCLKEFVRYSFFSILGTLGVSCYILADTFFVSKGLGANGLTALNLAIPVYNFIHGTGLMLGMGGATGFSIYKNQGKDKKAREIYTHAVILAIFISVVFLLIGLFFYKFIEGLLGADSEVIEMTGTYLKYLLLFSPAFILNDVFLCFIRNDGSPHLSMVAMLIGSIANILLDYIFIFPMEMGIFGAVFATGLSPVISIIIMLPHWFKKNNKLRFVKSKVQGNIITKCFSIGFPSLIIQISSGIVMIVFNIIILNLQGNAGVAAYGVVANLSLVVCAVYTGLAQGMQPLVSGFYGAGDKRTHTVLRYAVITLIAASVIIYLSIFFFAQPIAQIFNSENNPHLQTIAESGLRLYFLSSVFVGYNTVIAVYFTSVEKAVPAHILSLLRGFILIIPAAFLMASAFGMIGVWLSYTVSEIMTSIPGFVMYRKYKKDLDMV